VFLGRKSHKKRSNNRFFKVVSGVFGVKSVPNVPLVPLVLVVQCCLAFGEYSIF